MFEEYCNPKQNVTVLRYKFNTRVQRSNENMLQNLDDYQRTVLMEILQKKWFETGLRAAQVMHELKKNFCKLKRLTYRKR